MPASVAVLEMGPAASWMELSWRCQGPGPGAGRPWCARGSVVRGIRAGLGNCSSTALSDMGSSPAMRGGFQTHAAAMRHSPPPCRNTAVVFGS